MAIRKRNDFILSILSFAIGLFLFASESTVSGVMLFVGLPFLAEPRTFIQGISTNKEAAILTAMEVIHAELERLLSEPEFPLSDHQATSGKSE